MGLFFQPRNRPLPGIRKIDGSVTPIDFRHALASFRHTDLITAASPASTNPEKSSLASPPHDSGTDRLAAVTLFSALGAQKWVCFFNPATGRSQAFEKSTDLFTPIGFRHALASFRRTDLITAASPASTDPQKSSLASPPHDSGTDRLAVVTLFSALGAQKWVCFFNPATGRSQAFEKSTDLSPR
jgi:predicted component of type VI protein secretion system